MSTVREDVQRFYDFAMRKLQSDNERYSIEDL